MALSLEAIEALDPVRIESLSAPAIRSLLEDRKGDLSKAERKPLSGAKNHEQLEALIRWTRDEMTLVIAPIARYLTELSNSYKKDSQMAGAPFELDGTGPTLPDDEKTRWCAHPAIDR